MRGYGCEYAHSYGFEHGSAGDEVTATVRLRAKRRVWTNAMSANILM